MKTVLLDKLPTGKDRIISLQRRVISSVVYPAKTVVRKFRRKVVCSGSPMNPIDFKMRKEHNRGMGKPVVKYYEVK